MSYNFYPDFYLLLMLPLHYATPDTAGGQVHGIGNPLLMLWALPGALCGGIVPRVRTSLSYIFNEYPFPSIHHTSFSPVVTSNQRWLP